MMDFPMFTTLFYVILGIVIAGYLLETVLEALNDSWSGKSLPAILRGIFDEEKYATQQAYQHENYRFGLLTSGFNFLLILLMLLFGGFALVNELAASVSVHPVWWALLFFGIIMGVAGLLNLPFEIYDTFVIEEKYGFNRTTPKTWVTDKIKSLLLGALLGGSLLAGIILIYTKTGDWFWVMAWGVMAIFSLVMSLFYSSLIVPLFNKQTPLEEGELRTAIEKMAVNAGFRLSNVFVIDGSRRSARANAYFTGMGSKKRVVLYDTLLDEMTTQEIVAVLAHEIGHYRKKHVVWGLLLGLLQAGFMLFLFSLFVKSRALSQALGVDEPNFHMGLVAFGILYTPVSLITGIFTQMLSRRHEFSADEFAARHGQAGALSSALRKLAARNLIHLTPHPGYVFFNHSHPTLEQRLINLQKFIPDETSMVH